MPEIDKIRIDETRMRLIVKIDDIKGKITENESTPHCKQDLEFLFELEEHLDTILNAWYY